MSFVSDIAGAIGDIGAATVGSGINAWLTERNNKRMIAENRAAEERERAYNSPVEQMRRLKEAGLNPNLIYGSGGNTGNLSARATETNSPQIQFNPLDVLRAREELRNMKKTGENLDQQNKKTKAETRIAEAGADVAEHDANIITHRPGQRSTETPVQTMARSALDWARDRWKNFRKSISDMKKFDQEHPNSNFYDYYKFKNKGGD